MGDVFAGFRDDPELRVAILTGTGEKFFCPGWDLKAAAEGEAPDLAGDSLAQAVGLLVERPALEAALADATARFESDLSEGAYAEQQRLLKRKLEFDARLRQMASARNAALDGVASHNTAD